MMYKIIIGITIATMVISPSYAMEEEMEEIPLGAPPGKPCDPAETLDQKTIRVAQEAKKRDLKRLHHSLVFRIGEMRKKRNNMHTLERKMQRLPNFSKFKLSREDDEFEETFKNILAFNVLNENEIFSEDSCLETINQLRAHKTSLHDIDTVWNAEIMYMRDVIQQCNKRCAIL